jgi:hypothetical protein
MGTRRERRITTCWRCLLIRQDTALETDLNGVAADLNRGVIRRKGISSSQSATNAEKRIRSGRGINRDFLRYLSWRWLGLLTVSVIAQVRIGLFARWL